MDLQEKNVEFLQREYPGLWGRLEKGEGEGEGISVTSREARDGNPVLYIEKEGKEHRMNSPYRPAEEARRWAGQYSFSNICQTCMLFGLGNGLMLQELEKRGREDTRFIIYEPSMEVIRYLMEHSDMEDYLAEENVRVVWDEEMMRSAVSEWTMRDNISSNVICYHPGYAEIFPEEKESFLRGIRNGVAKLIVNENTERYFQKSFFQNLFHTFRRFSKGYLSSSLRTLAKEGVPVYIVSAGPSLGKNVGWLEKAKGHGVILVVDRAMRFLHQEGIQPDFLITVDPRADTIWLSDENTERIPLLAPLSGSNIILDGHKGDVYYFADFDYGCLLFYNMGLAGDCISAGGSVSTSALSLCVELGFQTIVFVGQDLALGKDGVTHAGSIHEEHPMEKMVYEVEGVDGSPVWTRDDYYRYLQWIESYVKSHPEVMFLDATEGGALIHGTRPVTLRETVEAYGHLSISCEEVMREAKRHPSAEEMKRFRERLRKDGEDLESIERAMERNVKAMEKLLRACENRSILTTSYVRTVEKVLEDNKKIEDLPVRSLLDRYVAKEAQEARFGITQMSEDDLENKKKVYRQAREYYKVMRDGARGLRREMREVLEELETEKKEV